LCLVTGPSKPSPQARSLRAPLAMAVLHASRTNAAKLISRGRHRPKNSIRAAGERSENLSAVSPKFQRAERNAVQRRDRGAGCGRPRNGVECSELKARSHGPRAKTVCALRTVAERWPRRAGTSIVARANRRAAVAQSVGASTAAARSAAANSRVCCRRVLPHGHLRRSTLALNQSRAVRPATAGEPCSRRTVLRAPQREQSTEARSAEFPIPDSAPEL